MINGVVQRPMDGVSMLYAVENSSAEDRHTTQYIEMFGNRAIYHEGWLAPIRLSDVEKRNKQELINKVFHRLTNQEYSTA